MTYQRIGQDANPITITGQGGTINNISDACTSIELKLKNGSTILDSERVPIVKDGKNGNPGEDAITILVSPENIEFNYSKSVIKQTVKVNVYKGGKKLSYSDGEFVCSTLTSNGSGRDVTTGLKWNFEVDGTDFYYTFMYISGNDINITIPFTVTVDDVKYEQAIYVHTVKNGSQGIQGCIYRRSKFANGFEYHNDSELTSGLRYIDLVYIMTDSTIYASHAKWFRCKQTHVSGDSNAPQLTSNGTEAWLEYWEPLNTMAPIYTPLLLADDAIITLMQSNQILIANDDGDVTAGMSGSMAGGKIRIWAGSATPDNAPFRVDVNGKMTATNAEITGNVKATTGNIGNWFIYQDCIASTHGTINGVESDDYTSPDFRPDVVLNGATGELVLYSDKYPRLRLSNASIVSLFNEYLLPNAQIDKNFSKSCSVYVPYSGGMFNFGVGNLGTISLGFMEEGSTINLSLCSIGFYVPGHSNNSSATVNASVTGANLKIKVLKNGSVVTTFAGTSGISKAKGEYLSISFPNKSYTIPEGGEGNYSLEVELKEIGFTVSSSGLLSNLSISTSVKGSYQHGGFNKTVIGNDGFGSFWENAGFIFSKNGLITRFGNIGFRVTSSGIQKSTNASVSNPTWTNI